MEIGGGAAERESKREQTTNPGTSVPFWRLEGEQDQPHLGSVTADWELPRALAPCPISNACSTLAEWPSHPIPHGTFTNPACTPCHCETEREHFARPVSPSCSLPYLPPLVTKVPAFFGSSSLHYFWGVGWARGESRLIFSLSWGRAETSEGKYFSVPFLFKFLCVNYGIFQFLLQKQSPQHETIGRIGDRLINVNHSI